MISFTMNKWLRHNDADDVSLYVQECGGHFEVTRHNIEFFVPVEYRDFILIKYPFLEEVCYVY